MDISCKIVVEKAAMFVNKQAGLEILGAGMVHPNVLDMAGYEQKNILDLHLVWE